MISLNQLFRTFLPALLLWPAALTAQDGDGSARKVSPAMHARLQSADKAGRVQAYVRLAPGTDVQELADRHGVRFNVGTGNLYTASIPAEAFDRFAAEAEVLRVEAGREVRPMMDIVRPLTQADRAQAGTGLPHTFSGKGVIIGIVDSGFDFTHPNFRAADGTCRILRVWDQNRQAGGNLPDYGYGRTLDTAEDIAAAAHDQSGDTHGTHVAGIAAGSAGNGYDGIAPESDLILVSTNKTEQGIIDGIDFLIRCAKEAERPIAINLSFGSVLGWKDGSGNFSLLLDGLLREEKGCLLSVAVGNEGHRNSTLSGTADAKSFLQVPSYGRDNLFLQGAAGHAYTLRLTLRDTVTNTVLLDERFTTDETGDRTIANFGTEDAEYSSLAVSVSPNAANGATGIAVNLSYYKQPTEAWTVSVSGDGGAYMLNCDYGSFTSEGKEGFCDGNRSGTMAATASGLVPITVGAYVSRDKFTNLAGQEIDNGWQAGDIYPRSGQGPTFDGRTKPDITAPGASVVSSYNSYAAAYSISESEKVWKASDATGRTYFWGIGNGTSMATPVVTGTMALWLEADAGLTHEEAKEILRSTARHDDFTAGQPGNVFGQGKLDVLEGLKFILQQTGIDAPATSETANWLYDRAEQRILAAPGCLLRLHDLNGRLVGQTAGTSLDISRLPAGIYLLNVGTGNRVRSFKIVK